MSRFTTEHVYIGLIKKTQNDLYVSLKSITMEESFCNLQLKIFYKPFISSGVKIIL